MSSPLIRNLILTHWQNCHPTTFAEFQKENRLETELNKMAEQFSDLMYSLVVEQQMEYSKAWEIAIDQFLLPEEEESSSTSRNRNDLPPATSE